MKISIITLIVCVLPNNVFSQFYNDLSRDVGQQQQFIEVFDLQDGKKHGYCEFRYGNMIQAKGNYNLGERHGEWVYFSMSADTLIKGTYINGIKTGRWIYYKDGHKKSEIIFNPAAGVDTSWGYYSNGQLAVESIRLYASGKDFTRQFYKNGQIKEQFTSLNRAKDGLHLRYDSTGRKLLELEYKNRVPYHLSHSIESTLFYDFFSGELNDGNGILYIHVFDTIKKEYHKEIKLSFKDGFIHGDYERYYENGKLRCKGDYHKNYLAGEFSFYDEEGFLMFTRSYDFLESITQDTHYGIIPNIDIFLHNGEYPRFLGGHNNEFRTYIQQKLKYPPLAAENGISGKVFVQFSINELGELIDAKVVEGVNPMLDREAHRVTRSSPFWEPGYLNSLPVKIQFTYPISFYLQ